jgi:hypothetical protein
MTLYCSEQITLIILPVLAYAVVVSKSFYWGGSAEEFCIPMMCFGLYCILKQFRNASAQNTFKLSIIFTNGILAGVIAQIKYTLLGFYFAWIIIVLLECLMQKEYKRALKNGFVFLSGMILASVPWLIYFVVNGAMKDWYQCYIYDNVFLYGDISSKRNLGLIVYDLSKILYYLILDNASYFVPIIIGMIFVLLSKNYRWYDKINVYILFGFTFIGIYIGGANLPYYSLPLTIFSIIGFCAIGSIIDRFGNYFMHSKAVLVVLACATVSISIYASYKGSMNTFFIGYNKEDFFLFRFKKIVEKKENPTLLTYNCLDAGLYTVADIMPTCRFYHRCNLDLDEMEQEQDRFIEEGLTDFVLTRDTYPEIIFDKYELVDEEIYEQVGADWQFTYYLFELKGD